MIRLFLIFGVSLGLGFGPAWAEAFQEITVQAGDTLTSVAGDYLKDPGRWSELLKYNRLPSADPSAPLPGMKIRIPADLLKENSRKATLVYVLNEVRYRQKDQPSWSPARKDMDIYDDDGLRTMERSEARIRFHGGNVLKLAENSLVVIRPELRSEEINLLSGSLRATQAKTITPTAEISPRSEGTVYKTRVRPDKGTIVQVEQGSAEVLGLETGKKVIVPAGYANITLPKKPPSAPVVVPDLPGFETVEWTSDGRLIVPPGRSKRAAVRSVLLPASVDRLDPEDRSSIPRLTPEAKVSANAVKAQTNPGQSEKVNPSDIKNWKAYRLQVSKGADFHQIVWDKKKDMTPEGVLQDWRQYGLPDGHYYRRVSYFDASGAETPFYSFPPADIDTVPPKITLIYPQEGFRTWEGDVSVEGRTESDCFLTINGYSVAVKSDGKFYWSAVLVNEGVNPIRIVATDQSGNSTELVRNVIYSKY